MGQRKPWRRNANPVSQSKNSILFLWVITVVIRTIKPATLEAATGRNILSVCAISLLGSKVKYSRGLHFRASCIILASDLNIGLQHPLLYQTVCECKCHCTLSRRDFWDLFGSYVKDKQDKWQVEKHYRSLHNCNSHGTVQLHTHHICANHTPADSHELS